MGFDFDRETRRRLGYQLIDRINDYFSSLPDRPVQLPEAERTFGQLTEKMPEIGAAADQVLDDLCRELIDKGFHVPAAGYFGLMNPTPTYMAVLAEALVAALNPQLATLARSQLASKIESETVRWIGERIFGLRAPGSGLREVSNDERRTTDDAPRMTDVGRRTTPFDGTFTSGGNEANFSALALALAAKFPEAVEDGIASIGARPVFYASEESHHSLDKSAGLLGLGRKALRRIPIDARVQLDPRQLEAQIERDLAARFRPFAVVATAGTTNSGAIDDIPALAGICRRYDLWLHVDGAYGAAAVFSDRHRGLVQGIERADSVTIDPHKWLAMPFAAGVVLTAHPELLKRAFGIATPYMPKVETQLHLVDNFKVSTQWSRRMNSLKLYLTLRVHGRQAYEELIDRQLRLAASFADWVRASDDFDLAAPQVLPILNLRLKLPGAGEAELDAAHGTVVDQVTRDGRRWISKTWVAGRSVLRAMVISYLTGEEQISALQHALAAAAHRLRTPAPAKP
jgi:glutamate/tyrosine decarboxylase-like PLP-dependent enzyme